jgi:23S rRNA (guanosine2251-2'-O)-methyltransferase
MAVLAGIHPIREALRSGQTLERVLIARGAGGPRLQEIIDLCRQAGVPVRFEPKDQLDRLSNNAHHQGVVAVATGHRYAGLDEIKTGKGLIVLLDGVEDPHNLGAIIRTAHAAGAAAIMIPERRAAGVSETVAKASAGAVAYLPVVRVGNINRALEDLKKDGYWIYGLDERGEHDYTAIEYAAPTAFVLGGEGKGLHQQVIKHCDFLVKIPMAGQVSSLNVSVAAGVVLFEWRRKQQST